MPLVRNRNFLSDPKHIFYRQLLLINGAFSLNHVCPLFNSNERVFLFLFFVFKSEIEFTRFTGHKIYRDNYMWPLRLNNKCDCRKTMVINQVMLLLFFSIKYGFSDILLTNT